MFIRKWAGFRSLPSRYGGIDGSFPRSSVEAGSSKHSSHESENASVNPVSFSRSLLPAERILPSKSPFPSQLKSNGGTAAPELSNPEGASMTLLHPGPPRAVSVGSQPGSRASYDRTDVPRNLAYSTQPPSSSLRRRNSLSHVPNHATKDFHSHQPWARKRWSGSQPDLQAKFSEGAPRSVELRDAGDSLAGQPEEFGARNLELEVDLMEFELSSLRQKQMASSFAYLEKERKWLEDIRSEGRKRKGELDDKIFKMEMDLAKTKSYFAQRDHCLLCQGFGRSEHATQETLDVGQELRSLQNSLSSLKTCIKALEEKRNEMVEQLKGVQESSAIHPTATKSLEAKRERRRLQAAYKNIKQKNVALLQQVQHLSSELKHAQKNQEGSGQQIPALQSELARNKNRASQPEEEEVLVKEEMRFFSQAKEELPSTAAESHQRLGALLEKLHLLEQEKESHANHVRALEDERTRLLEEKEKHLLERRAEKQGKEESRKALQETCEHLRQSQIQLQKEKGLLQVHCRDLERQAEELGKQLEEQRSISQDWRSQWEDVGAALKTKGEELEKMRAQNQALEAKDTEWSSEKQRLQQLVRGLEEQLAEKDQALRDLRQSRDVERAALEARTSSEPKIAREGPGTSYEKGRPASLEGKVIANQLEGLRLQHQSVTEQLKEPFRQRQEPQAGARKHQDGTLKGKRSTAPHNVPPVLTTSQESLGRLSEERHLEAGDASKREEEEQSLRQQLEAKTDVISAMACEIQTLKEKNENLIQAKRRFQEQIQHIRQLSKRPSGKEAQVSRLSTSLGDDGRRARCHEILEVSSRKDEAPSSSHQVEIEEECHACAEEQKDTSPNIRMAQSRPLLLPAGPSLQSLEIPSNTSSASDKLLLAPAASPKGPLKHVEDEAALLSPRSPRLLSPKPFGPPRPWSPFRERAESPESGEL